MSEPRARALARRLLAEELPDRWLHVQAVAGEASRLCDAIGIDRTLVVVAAWLHDIGYASSVAETGFHPLDGARYLRAHGWNEVVCRLVAHHTDAAGQAPTREVGEQVVAEFPEVVGRIRDVLWAADATTGPEGQCFTLNERIAEIAERYGVDHQVTRRMIASKPVLAEVIARVEAALSVPRLPRHG